jgi:hypothetical protein
VSDMILDNDSSLAGAIRAAMPGGKDVYLTLRNDDGDVLWSHVITMWSIDASTRGQTRVGTQPVEERIRNYADFQRDLTASLLTGDARKKGIL